MRCALLRSECDVRHSHFAGAGAKHCYIADNTIQGITPWRPEAMGANGDNMAKESK